ncbi:MAG TPA: glycosyltransferase family 2 protein [Candidatus Hydrogenedentes bacterium]|nr:glycosyltransferase family 2 protein [Candidatus Hydrogenedentota bacterium]
MITAEKYRDTVARPERPLIAVVIPVYCEAASIRSNLAVIDKSLQIIDGINYAFLLVDDGSTDQSWEEIQSIAAADSRVRALRFSRNFGKEAAIAAGLEHAEGDAVIVMDADLQHPPHLIPEMVRLWREEAFDIVDAVKQDRGKETMLYRLSVALFTAALCSVSGFDMRGSSDFKLLDRNVVTAWLAMKERVTFYRAMTEWLGFRHMQLPMSVAPRAAGMSRWNLARLVRLATTAMTAFSTSALHLTTALGALFVLSAFLFGLYTLGQWLRGYSLEGFATVILLQLIIGGCIMVALGIVGEYIATIFQEVKRRPRYIIRDQTE